MVSNGFFELLCEGFSLSYCQCFRTIPDSVVKLIRSHKFSGALIRWFETVVQMIVTELLK